MDQENQAFAVQNQVHSLWHARLGHPGNLALKHLFPKLEIEDRHCKGCVLGKQTRMYYPISNTIYENAFELFHSDVWTSPIVSHNRFKYFVTFIDHKTRYTWIYLLVTKSEVFEALKSYYIYVTKQFNENIKILRSDHGVNALVMH